jgi:hypothetical protein
MKKTALFLIVLAAAAAATTAFAQSAPLRGAGLLALNTTESLAGNANTVVEASDSGGGGSTGARSLRGSDAPARTSPVEASSVTITLPDAAPSKSVTTGDPTDAAAATPKRPTYRWQSLVPGAIK